ncbi:hypothetical protein NM688_g9292 [Phlebia brevispora]|uniref:Uncharacterized protein n=1 Tax=Phlebia brevispora TaxID=194682 RepID=A0ACC1RH91_9APHY|nr:hypothetical protein NM688_g9292 [Phlebia brevispora]
MTMAENTAFSSSGEDAISRTIEVQQEGVPIEQNFEDFYDIDRTVQEILKGDYKRIALQFPDELLHDSVPIFRTLKSKVGADRELYVLADTSYGRQATVMQLRTNHVNADAMVHYGHACMSQTSRLPVIYVFGKKPIDVSDCVEHLLQSTQSTQADMTLVTLRTNVAYAHVAEQVVQGLRAALPPTTHLSYTPIPLLTKPQEHLPSSEQDAPSVDADSDEKGVILYVGEESLALTNLLVTHASCEIHSYDPKTRIARLESSRSNKLLMRRYVAVQKARDADVFGILVGTLGVASYLPLISRLRSLLARAHKKSYTVTVGKLNPAKLGNFLEIECFVLVACPENSMIEAKDFLRPIITPYELEIALQPEPQWTGEYILDFGKLALKGIEETPGEGSEDEDRPMFSLVTGQYRSAKRYGDHTTPTTDEAQDGSSAVVLRNQDGTVAVMPDSAAAQFLQSRTFRGLETRIGEDAPSVLEQGRSGIARGYEDDHSGGSTS